MDLVHAPYPDKNGIFPVTLRYLCLFEPVVVAVPDCGGIVRSIAAEPFIDVIGSCTGLSACVYTFTVFVFNLSRTPVRRSVVVNNCFQDVAQKETGLLGINTVADRSRSYYFLAFGIQYLCIGKGFDICSACGKCVISSGHFKSCHTLGKSAQRL